MEAVIAGRQRHCAGGCNAEKTLALLYEAERPSCDLQPMARGILSLTRGSGLFLGPWDVGCARPSEGQQWQNNFQLRDGAARRHRGPSAMRTTCLLRDLSGRDNCQSQGDKDLRSVGAFQPCQHPLPSPPQAVLHCPTPAPLSLQALGTHFASPTCSHLSIFVCSLVCLHPHWLFLPTQSHGLMHTPSG